MKISIRDLVKRYGATVATNIVRRDVEEGESIGLVGNNGAGKTTLLRLILDLVRPTQGEVLLDGEVNSRHTGWKPLVSSYLDEHFLIGFLTAREFFNHVGIAYGLTQGMLECRLEPYSQFLSEDALGGRYIRELSMGNKKKVGIVAAMLVEPKLLILDEPFANLDPYSRNFLKEALVKLHQTHQTTTIISSHDLSDILNTCNRILILENGRIVHDVPTKDTDLKKLAAYFSPEE